MQQNQEPEPTTFMTKIRDWHGWFPTIYYWCRTIRGWGRTTVPPEEEFIRFKALVGSLLPFPKDFPNADMLTKLLAKNPNQVTWSELEAGHLALVDLMGEELLRARFDSLTQEYETVTETKPFRNGAFKTPPETLAGWRAGVLSLMEDLVKFRNAKKGFERVHSVLGIFGIVIVGFILFVWTIFVIPCGIFSSTLRLLRNGGRRIGSIV